MNYTIYSHMQAETIIPIEIKKSVISIIEDMDVYPSKLSTKVIREQVTEGLMVRGWSKPVKLSHSSNITITSVYKNIALCLQTGNMSRFYADLLKLQYLYINNKTKAAFYIIPNRYIAKIIGSNVANFERFVEELELFKKIITIPILVVGLE